MPLRMDRLEPKDAFPEIAERFLGLSSYHQTIADRPIDLIVPREGLKPLSYAEALWTASWQKYQGDMETLRGIARSRAVSRR